MGPVHREQADFAPLTVKEINARTRIRSSEATIQAMHTRQRSRNRRHAWGLWICIVCLFSGPELFAQATEQDSSHRLGIGDLPRDLVKNARGLLSRNNLLPTLIGGAASIAAHPADTPIKEDVYRSLGSTTDAVGARLGSGPVVLAGVGSLWAVSRFRGSETFVRFSDDLAQASILNAVITASIKASVHRTRPDGGSRSFPSGHTSAAFAAASVVGHHYGLKASLVGYTAATFVGVSRIDSHRHYLSDVIAGATVGYVTGRTVSHRDTATHSLVFMPIFSPSRRTAGVAVTWIPRK